MRLGQKKGTILSIRYHDEEWGVPVHDDRRWFEFLVLEGAQAGLSWDTILRKRTHYRRAFADFDPAVVARFNVDKIEELLGDPGIVRNRLKVTSVVRNAQAFLKIQKEFGSFDAYIWPFVGGQAIQEHPGGPSIKCRPALEISDAAEQGPETPRFHVRRLDDLLCLDAGDWVGERPRFALAHQTRYHAATGLAQATRL